MLVSAKTRARSFSSMPKNVSGLIIGGGITGCSILYHLAKHPSLRNGTHLLVEKGELTSGATWHAAGLCTYFHGGNNFRFWHAETLDLFRGWQAEGTQLSLHTPGSIRLIESKERMDEARHQLEKARLYARLFGTPEMALIGPEDIRNLHPLCNVTGLYGGLLSFDDGHTDPSSATNEYVRRAKELSQNVHVQKNSTVVNLNLRTDKKWEVTIDKGGETHAVVADFVINAAGLWCDNIGRLAGITTPCVVLQHQYIITEDIPEVKEYHEKHGKQMPVLRDLKGSYYLRDEGNGILIGPYEHEDSVVLSPEEWRSGHNSMPMDHSYFLFDEGLDRLLPHIEVAAELVPQVASVGIRNVVNGPTCWPADGSHLVGPSFEKPNYWMACAESYGIAHSGGLGRYLVDWVANGEPPYELNEADPARYGPWASRQWVGEKVKETYGWNNIVSFPNNDMPRARPAIQKNKGIIDLLRDNGCQFGFNNGWEGPNWFNDKAENVQNNFATFHRPAYHSFVDQEVHGLLAHAGVLYWPFAKYRIKGPDAFQRFDRLVGNKLPVVGRASLCHMITETGKVMSEVTVCRIAEDEFYLVSYPNMQFFDHRWLKKHLGLWDVNPPKLEFTDVTDDFGVLMLNGPKSSEVVAKHSTSAFPTKHYSFGDVTIGSIPVRALKVSFIGEDGWELHMAQDDVPKVYKLLTQDKAVVNWGGVTMNTMRMEKGIPLFTKDFTKDHSALEAGLERFLDMKKDFLGKTALQEELKNGVKRKLVMLEVDSNDIDCVGNEPIYAGEKLVGFTTSGAFGHVCHKSLCFGYVPTDLPSGQISIPLLGTSCNAKILQKPPVMMAAQRRKAEAEGKK
eukprot:GEMP01014227.1.p1 GENE.GEMP01014227.1~~GEMP01014227.1.p1  ORF type:complete len:848 (+),score=195.38 GEMP01014227.1:180-2723(+)